MVRVIALVCTLLLVWTGYALACSPAPGDKWFDVSATIHAKTLPKNFVLRAGKIEMVGVRECILANGARFESYAQDSFTYLAKNNRHGDARPAHLKPPRPEHVKIEVYCDRKRHVTRGSFSYRRMDTSCKKWLGYDKWIGHMELDLNSVGHLIRTEEAGRYCSVSGDLLIERVEPVTSFCTMSAEALFDDYPPVKVQSFAHDSLSLAELARAKKHVGVDYKGNVTNQEAAKTRSFDVYADCYSSKYVIEATLRYTLNKSYVSNRRIDSSDDCDRKYRR